MNDDYGPIQIIKIDPMLPCGATPRNPHKICGKLTSLAYAVAMPESSILYNVPLPGRWLIQPLCAECAKMMIREVNNEDINNV